MKKAFIRRFSAVPLFNGVSTGLFLQLAIGPVFFTLLGITMESGPASVLSSVLAVTLVDYLYITLSIAGLGRSLKNERVKNIFGILSPIILVLFGVAMLYKGLSSAGSGVQPHVFAWTPVKSFMSLFILTLSSPLTIVFWGSIFAAKAIEKGYQRKQLVCFGIGAGAATFFFLMTTMSLISLLHSAIPHIIVQVSNGMVGLVLIYYGISRASAHIRFNKK